MATSKPDIQCSLHKMIRYIFATLCFVVLSAVVLYAVTGYPKSIYIRTRNVPSRYEDKRASSDNVMLGAVAAYQKTLNNTSENMLSIQGDSRPLRDNFSFGSVNGFSHTNNLQSKKVLPLKVDTNPTTENVVKRHWRKVGSGEAYVFSAYYKPLEHVVEMVGIVKKAKVNSTFYCLFPDREGGNNTYRYSAATEKVDQPTQHIMFQTVYIRCTIPLAITPPSVTLEMNRNYTILPIIYPETRNLYNLSVCFPSFFRNYSDYMRLVEAVESNVLFGVQFFTAYKHSVTDEVDKVFDYYIERGLMEVINWNKPGGKLHHDGQWSHIQDCHLSHRYKSKYVLVIDVDELIVPTKHRNLLDLLSDIEKATTFSPGSYMFRHAYFDVDYDEDTSSYPQKEEVEQLQIRSLKHVWRSSILQNPPRRVKSIHAPPRVETAGIHYTPKMVAGFHIYIVQPKLAYLHHYRHKWRIGKKTKDYYIRKYTSELVMNIKHVYKMLGFIK